MRRFANSRASMYDYHVCLDLMQSPHLWPAGSVSWRRCGNPRKKTTGRRSECSRLGFAQLRPLVENVVLLTCMLTDWSFAPAREKSNCFDAGNWRTGVFPKRCSFVGLLDVTCAGETWWYCMEVIAHGPCCFFAEHIMGVSFWRTPRKRQVLMPHSELSEVSLCHAQTTSWLSNVRAAGSYLCNV